MMSKQNRKRILVVSHGHPIFSPGGGEMAAYTLWQAYRRQPEVECAVFLSRLGGPQCLGNISKHGNDEYLWEQSLGDDFIMEGRNLWASLTVFSDFIKSIRPDIIHLHHAVHMGYEILDIIKRALPEAKICFTLHEYIPICHNSGQMLKKNGSLCHASGLAECARCFPKKTEADFWLRKRRFLHFFGNVDHFIAPSEFLARRYIEWGLPPEKISVLENGLRSMQSCPERKSRAEGPHNRFGFFGQITQFKGLSVVLDALSLLSARDRQKIILEIHGAGFGEAAEAHEASLRKKYKQLEKEGIIRWIGAYHPEALVSRMSGIDWVVMPSIWWENSPVIIQEAFACKRPVLASSIGGMAEKIANNINGILVEPGNSQAWADAMLECSTDNALWERLRGGIPQPMTADECARRHLEILWH